MAAKGTTGQSIATGKRQARDINERRRESYRLWFDEKKTLREVADVLGCSHQTVKNDLRAVLDHIADEFDEEIRSLRSKQLRRLLNKHDRLERIASDESVPVGDRIKAENAGTAVLKEISDVMGVKAPVKHANADGTNLPSSIIVEVINGTNGTTG